MTRLPHRAAAVAVGLVLCVAAGCSSSTSGGSAVGSSTTAADGHPRGSAGCGTPPPVRSTSHEQLGDVPRSVDASGQPRGYRLGVPGSYDSDEPAPLVVALHGSGGSAERLSQISGLPALADRRGVVTVTPDGIGGQWELTGTGRDDAFLVQVLDEVEAQYCIDLDRVHAVGISLGAWKAAITACTHPDRFASIVLVAEEVYAGCRSMPIVAIHGTADRVVPYGPGSDPGLVMFPGPNNALPGSRENIAAWAEAGGCSDRRRVEKLGDDVELWTYRECDPGVDVQLYTVLHGGHSWPGSDLDVFPTTKTIDASDVALDFFAAHPKQRST